MSIDENQNDSSMADRIEELTKENDAIAAAADRNAAKFTKIARCNREYIELNQLLLKEKKDLIEKNEKLIKKNDMLVEQVENADESRSKSDTGKGSN